MPHVVRGQRVGRAVGAVHGLAGLARAVAALPVDRHRQRRRAEEVAARPRQLGALNRLARHRGRLPGVRHRRRGHPATDRLQRGGRVQPPAAHGLARQRGDRVAEAHQPGAQVGHRGRGVGGQQQGRRAAHHRRRHRGAVHPRVAAGVGGRDRDARRAQVHALVAVVGEARQRVPVVGGRHADDGGGGLVAGRLRRGVVVGPVVARGRHQQRAGMPVQGGQEGLAGARPAQAHVHDARPAVGRVLEGGDDVRHRAAAVGTERPRREELRLPGDARDAGAVVAPRVGDARHVRAVAVVVLGRGVALVEVPPVDVVHEAVVVVVDAVARDLPRVGPEVRRQIGPGGVHPRVHHRDDHAGGAGGRRPRLGSVDVGVRGAGDALDGLARVVQPPLQREVGVVGHRGRVDRAVDLGVGDVRAALERPDRLRGAVGPVRPHPDRLDSGPRDRAQGAGVHRRPRGGAIAGVRRGSEGHHQARPGRGGGRGRQARCAGSGDEPQTAHVTALGSLRAVRQPGAGDLDGRAAPARALAWRAVPARSAGMLLYRLRDGRPEVLLVHPGGPFWARRDHGRMVDPQGRARRRRGSAGVRPPRARGGAGQRPGGAGPGRAGDDPPAGREGRPRLGGTRGVRSRDPAQQHLRDGVARRAPGGVPSSPRSTARSGSPPRRRGNASSPPRRSWWTACWSTWGADEPLAPVHHLQRLVVGERGDPKLARVALAGAAVALRPAPAGPRNPRCVREAVGRGRMWAARRPPA